VIDLVGLFLIALAWFTSGPADRTEWAWSVGLSVSYSQDGVAPALVVDLDPVLIRERPAPALYGWREGWTCGLTDGWNVWVHGHEPCRDILRHELYHVQQRRALGWLTWGLWGLGGGTEAFPRWTAENMQVPGGMNAPLFRLIIPLLWRTSL